jgi:ribosome maturation factor RimP
MNLTNEIEAIITPVLNRLGVDLVLGTFVREPGGKVLRLFIEKKGATPETGSGVDLGLCATVSREVSAALDVGETISDAYSLEVSSPGVERPLVRPQDFDRFAGRQAVVSTKGPVEGRRKFLGVLRGCKNGAVVMELQGAKRVIIPNELIKKANLVFDAKV